MPVSPKDQKLLWAKAAGRCCMPRCRKPLVEASSEHVSSKNVLVGESCHIVSEKRNGPRGRSLLTAEQRNRYPNLIVLCLHHHTVVDQDPKAWPVERLHQIKADHELWVETQLTSATESLADVLYSALVNSATEGLNLAHWDGISDHAIRSLLPVAFVDGVDDFTEQIFKTIWPGEKPQLEQALMNLAARADAFVKHFLPRAYVRHDRFYAEDKRWKSEVRQFELREKLNAESSAWQKTSANLLVNLVVALNEFGDAVRKFLNPRYFYLQGKFTVHDSLGVTNDMRDVHYLPSSYIAIAP